MNTAHNLEFADQAGRLLTPKQAAELTGLSPKTLANMRCSGRGPAFFRVGGRLCRYDEHDLTAWMRSRRYTSTSQEAGA